MKYSKQNILAQQNELELNTSGDFVIRKELIEQYEPIDFHAHCYIGIASMLPALFRSPKSSRMNKSFFDLSCYPGNIKNFDFEKVGYRTWPKTSFSISGMEALAELFALKGVIPMLQNASIDRVLQDMKQSHVKKMVLLPIQGLQGRESENCIEATRKYEEFIVFGSVHPNETNIQNKINSYLDHGIKGFKIAPHVWNIGFNDKRVFNLLGHLSETKLPILSCSGLAIPATFKNLPFSLKKSMETQTAQKYAEVLRQFPDLKLIFAHSGLEQNDAFVELMKQYPSTYADISTQPPANIKKMIHSIGADRLLFGSDYPFFNQAFPLLAILKATNNEEERKKIFSINARNLLNI
jgi:hypothetical protein